MPAEAKQNSTTNQEAPAFDHHLFVSGNFLAEDLKQENDITSVPGCKCFDVKDPNKDYWVNSDCALFCVQNDIVKVKLKDFRGRCPGLESAGSKKLTHCLYKRPSDNEWYCGVQEKGANNGSIYCTVRNN